MELDSRFKSGSLVMRFDEGFISGFFKVVQLQHIYAVSVSHSVQLEHLGFVDAEIGSEGMNSTASGSLLILLNVLKESIPVNDIQLLRLCMDGDYEYMSGVQ